MAHFEKTLPLIIIRPARVADAMAMAHVMVDTYLTAHRGQMPEAAWEKRQAEWTYDESARSWRGSLQGMADGEDLHECIYVAEVEDVDRAYPQLAGKLDAALKVVGLVTAHPATEELLPNAAEIGAIYVVESYHGLGIGRKLMQAAASHMQALGYGALLVGALAANAPARSFYEVMGGVPVGERSFDEEGYQLPEVVYGWSNISAIV